MKRRALVPFLLVVALGASVSPARGDVFGSIGLLSQGSEVGAQACGSEPPAPSCQQALYAHDSAIAGGGRYVAFDGYFGGRAGVWRRDGQTGEIQPVAVGVELPGGTTCVQGACDAELPSISDNGQYVSFTTTAALAPTEDFNAAPDVYVRNMGIAESQPGAYTLASAVNGKSEGLTYEGSNADGAVAAGRSAISADGQKVAFVTTAISNLTACQPGAPPESQCEASSAQAPAVSTPALQVGMRNLATRETQLVSVEYDPETGLPIPDKPVSVTQGGLTYGAVYSQSAGPPQFPFTNNRAYALPLDAVGASISADGTTVAWMGATVYEQARMLAAETEPRYSEPLWRRIADGPNAPTRRVTGGSEPESPACIASGEIDVPFGASPSDPCQGPFAVEPGYGVWAGAIGNTIPQLSADGYAVGFLATAQLASLGVDFGRSSEAGLDDLYVADMHEGLTRTQALRPLTQFVSGEGGDQQIVDLGISPELSLVPGSEHGEVAFATQRIIFPLGSPAYVSQPAAVLGLGELFDVDLGNDTLTRVTNGYEGGADEHPHTKVSSAEPPYKLLTDGALSPSFSDDGNTIAFSSTASNLVYGDGNTPATEEVGQGSSDGSDVFDIQRQIFPPESPETYASPAPPYPSVVPAWTLSVRAVSLSNGYVRLYVEVPGAGKLSAAAEGAVKVSVTSRAARAKTRGRSSAKRKLRTTVAERVLARTAKAIGGSGLVEMTLALTPSFKTLATRPGGFSGSAKLVFTAPGHPALKRSIAVSFVHRVRASKSSHSKKRAASQAKGRR